MLESLQDWAVAKRNQFLSPDSLGERFARGAFWSFLGTAIAQGFRLIAAIVTARLLGKISYGELGMIQSTVGTFGVFAGLGLGLTATKYIAEWRHKDPARAGRILGLLVQVTVVSGGFVSVFFFLFAPLLAVRMLNAPHLVRELRLGCALLFPSTWNGVQTGTLAGLEAFKAITKVNLVRGMLNLPLVIVGVWLFDLPGAVAAFVIVEIIGWGLNQIVLRKECQRNGIVTGRSAFRAELPILWRFSLPAFLSNLLVGPVLWIANTILVNQPEGYGELGLLSAANQWRTFLMFLPTVLLQVALPLMSSVWETNTRKDSDYGRTLILTQSLTVAAVFPLGTLLMFLSDWIMQLYGGSFANGSLVLVGVVCSIMIASVGSAAGPAIQARGAMWLGLAINACWGVVLVAFVWFFAPLWKANSIPFGSALGYIVTTLWAFLYLLQDLPGGLLKRVFMGLGFVVLLTLFCLGLSPQFRLILSIPATFLTIFVSVFFLTDKSVPQTAVHLLRSVVKGG